MPKKTEALALAPDYAELTSGDNSVGAKRYERFRQGKTIQEIADEDGVKFETVKMDVLAYEKKFDLSLQSAIVRQRIEGELSNEKLRKEIRSRVHKKVLKSIDHLIEGKRKYVFFDQAAGKVVTVNAHDWNMMLAGIKEFSKLVSLEQKPAVPSTVVNVNQTNNNTIGQGDDFEERMRKIKKQQQESIAAAEAEKVIDVEAEDADEDGGPEWDF